MRQEQGESIGPADEMLPVAPPTPSAAAASPTPSAPPAPTASAAPASHPGLGDARHWLGFVIAGGLAFATDASVLWLLTTLGQRPLVARIGAILVAMLVAWLAHRRLTFRVAAPPSLAEFRRYAAVAWSSAACNYAVFAAILLALPATAPFLALVASSLVAMAMSYLGMRYAAFRADAPR